MGTSGAGTPHIEPASDQSLLIHWGGEPGPESGRRVLQLLRLLESEPIPGVRNLHPAYCSLLVTFDPLTHGRELQAILESYLARVENAPLPEPRRVEIPACYGDEFGPDLPAVAARHGMTAAQVIEAHAAAEYVVSFLGFVPGFAYLTGLPASLATPRLERPRLRVPSGSVGIAGNQTGVYPLATPGGWNLIGRTPLAMFRADRAEMSLLSIGDHVRLTPITAEQFAAAKNS